MESVNSVILGRCVVKVNSRKVYNCLEGIITIKNIFDKIYDGPCIPGTLLPMFPDDESYYKYIQTNINGSAIIKFLERFSFSKNNKYRIVIIDKRYRITFYGSIKEFIIDDNTSVTFDMMLYGKKNRLFQIKKI